MDIKPEKVLAIPLQAKIKPFKGDNFNSMILP
jgi:hypothetical protein